MLRSIDKVGTMINKWELLNIVSLVSTVAFCIGLVVGAIR